MYCEISLTSSSIQHFSRSSLKENIKEDIE